MRPQRPQPCRLAAKYPIERVAPSLTLDLLTKCSVPIGNIKLTRTSVNSYLKWRWLNCQDLLNVLVLFRSLAHEVACLEYSTVPAECFTPAVRFLYFFF